MDFFEFCHFRFLFFCLLYFQVGFLFWEQSLHYCSNLMIIPENRLVEESIRFDQVGEKWCSFCVFFGRDGAVTSCQNKGKVL